MNKLYPIIRRVRCPLLPPDEPPQRVVIPVTVEAVPMEIVQVIAAPEPSAPPASRPRKESKRAQAPAT